MCIICVGPFYETTRMGAFRSCCGPHRYYCIYTYREGDHLNAFLLCNAADIASSTPRPISWTPKDNSQIQTEFKAQRKHTQQTKPQGV